ncbi:MAG: AAA family ATPase [Proteobacteria bacterium]|jgi:SpoVK/Ycf46/Vps4 family AAA+-type ATPase|nr:AAA family ATPase [Pseudomonadota bacterium]
MNTSQYLEFRLKQLNTLCAAYAAGETDAIATYENAINALDATADDALPFIRLANDFSLSPFEKNVIFMALAPTIDASFKQKIIDIRRNFSLFNVDVGICLEIFSANLEERIQNRKAFLPTAPLMQNHLVELKALHGADVQLNEMIVALPSRIVSHILEQETDIQFDGFSRLVWPKTTLDQVMLSERQQKQVFAIVSQYEHYLDLKKSWNFEEIGGGGRNLILLFSGKSGTGKTLLAHAIAHSLKRPLLLVDAHELEARRSLEDNLDLLLREARLRRAVLLFDDCELLFGNRTQGNRDLPLLLAALDAYEGLAILSTNIPTALDPALDRRVTLQIDFDIPSAPLREKIWRLHIPDQLMLADDVDLPHLAEKYEFAGGTIRNAIAVAMNRALADAALNGSELVLNMAMLDDAAKTQIRNKIKKLADKTRTTLTLDDLVLPRKLKEQLRSIIAAVRNRRKIFEEWGFGEKLTTGRGLCVLFRGDSGTGKTLSAEIIANELGMTLYRVRIPAIVSKYVGETEKNLEKCFREAAASGALLLFDEADSIFSKRTEVKDANDRYSNMEVNLLLQEVERFQGVVILTTNLDAAIDDAFERRLNHKLDFPFPEARDRARIWKRLLPKQAPLSDDIDFEALGRDFDLAGGNIKNAVIRAAYQAAEHKTQINMDLLEACGLQEYREMGKLVPNRRNPWD